MLARPFHVSHRQRAVRIGAEVLALSESEIRTRLSQVEAQFGNRHVGLRELLVRRFEQVRPWLRIDERLPLETQRLLGAYFTHEYALEAAALFNPSIVPHPDQSELPSGTMRFILSLRATGEGHISSITFRTGTVDDRCRITISAPSRTCLEPALEPFAAGRRGKAAARATPVPPPSQYAVQFPPQTRLSERVLFPVLPSQSNGIEDARFVRFQDEDGTATYYATYTAYDGQRIHPQFVETSDFLRFTFVPLRGRAVRNKGMALFPRKIGGRYAMLGRQDAESLYVGFSDQLHVWRDMRLVLQPAFPWELTQIGNCGSPIETPAGWLVISHGVGPMRTYCIGAFLLDRDDPTQVIGRLREPLIEPNEHEREGYVPNVVYSCGSLVHGHQLVIPYAFSDYATTFATVPLEEVLAAMQ